jgi:predicted secreted protein
MPAQDRGGEHRENVALVVDEDANGSELVLQIGQLMHVRLNENRMAGYKWQVLSSGAPVCDFVRESYAAVDEGYGKPGAHSWVFRAAQTGGSIIELVYRRPWQTNAPVRRFTVTVRVLANT